MQLGSMFICNCNIALHVSGSFCVHLQEHLETVVAASGEWHETGSNSGSPYVMPHETPAIQTSRKFKSGLRLCITIESCCTEPCLKQSVPGFNPRPFSVEFLVDDVPLCHISLYLDFPRQCLSSIHVIPRSSTTNLHKLTFWQHYYMKHFSLYLAPGI